MKTHRKLSNLTIHIILLCYCVIVLSPLLIVVSGSFRQVGNNENFLKLFTQFTLESYQTALDRMSYFSALKNSVVNTVIALVVIVMFNTAAAYPIARIKTRLSRFMYYFFIAGLIIPSQMVIIPVTQMIKGIGIPSSQYTAILMFITTSIPFTIFLYTGFIKGIPVELDEAAYLDGAGILQRFYRVVFPLLKPAVISSIITQGSVIWNDYFYTMIFVSRESQQTLPVALIQFLGDKENPAQWTVLFAACILCAIPLIILFGIFQKHFIGGISAGAVKG